jgi:hypothetical protein
MTGDPVLKLRMRGSVYRDVWMPLADSLLEHHETRDLADAISRVGLKRVGGGYRAFVSLTHDQARRLAEHLPKAHGDFLLKLVASQGKDGGRS